MIFANAYTPKQTALMTFAASLFSFYSDWELRSAQATPDKDIPTPHTHTYIGMISITLAMLAYYGQVYTDRNENDLLAHRSLRPQSIR